MYTQNYPESMRQRAYKARIIGEELVEFALRIISNYALAGK